MRNKQISNQFFTFLSHKGIVMNDFHFLDIIPKALKDYFSLDGICVFFKANIILNNRSKVWPEI